MSLEKERNWVSLFISCLIILPAQLYYHASPQTSAIFWLNAFWIFFLPKSPPI